MSEKLKIDFVSGGGDGNDLRGCYFKQRHDGTFDFHDQDDRIIAQKVTLGSSFKFKLDGVRKKDWTLSITAAPVVVISGSWSDGTDPAGADGTYQAQAGGDEESASSACA